MQSQRDPQNVGDVVGRQAALLPARAAWRRQSRATAAPSTVCSCTSSPQTWPSVGGCTWQTSEWSNVQDRYLLKSSCEESWVNDKRCWIEITLHVQHVRDLVGRQALARAACRHQSRSTAPSTRCARRSSPQESRLRLGHCGCVPSMFAVYNTST